MALEGNRISLLTALTFAQRRAQKSCFKQFGILYKSTEVLNTINYAIALAKTGTVGETTVFNTLGVAGNHRNKYRRYIQLLYNAGYITITPRNGGQSVGITDLGYTVLDHYEKQFYTILQAGETKYKKRLKYGYLEQLPDLRK